VDTNYRDTLLTNYSSTHIDYLDLDRAAKLEWFTRYCERNYLTLLKDLNPRSAAILEVGCNQGYLLKALYAHGFTELHGVDLSPDDVERANQLIPEASIVCAEASAFLNQHTSTFAAIITKATLEHIPKGNVIPFLQAIRDALKPGGLAIVDVPNMDWLLASHERYMDFTHESGFTRESLAQVMRNVFGDVTVIKAQAVAGTGFKSRLAVALRPPLIKVISFGLRILGEGAADTWWSNRGIIAIGRCLKSGESDRER